MSESERKTKSRSLLKRSPFSLGRYYFLNIVIYSIATFFILQWNHLFDEISPWWIVCLVPLFVTRFRYIPVGILLLVVLIYANNLVTLSWSYLVLFPVVVYLGCLSSVWSHNAVHNNFKIKWLNRVIGEVCALQQLASGFPIFRLIHTQHHGYTDDIDNDPHPVQGFTFWAYIDSARTLIVRWMKSAYMKQWGDSEKTQRYWQYQEVLLILSRFSKAFFLFSLMGPAIFVLLFLPSYVSSLMMFASFNYYAHRENADGEVEVLNLDDKIYYKICNKILFGVMYHKNHHLQPRLFNPMHMK